METIKNYLESMFRGLPQTEKVMKAKSELLQMMEDKYTELIRSGKTENEAVGEVIQNFGNLDDLADDLGIMDILHQTKYSDVQRRKVSFEEITEYLAAAKRSVLMRAAGIFLCITCVVFPILIDSNSLHFEKLYMHVDVAGAVFMFLSIGLGVVLMCISGSSLEPWKYLKTEACSIDAVSIDYLKNKIRDFTPTYSVLSSVGVLLCILCFIPAAILDEINNPFLEDLGGALLFLFVGAGVFMMVYAKQTKRIYHKLLNLNDKVDFEEDERKSLNNISNNTVRVIMSAYWSIVTCLYLCISFLTFRWEITWLIWPIAVAVNTIIRAIYSVKDDTKKAEKETGKEVAKNYED